MSDEYKEEVIAKLAFEISEHIKKIHEKVKETNKHPDDILDNDKEMFDEFQRIKQSIKENNIHLSEIINKVDSPCGHKWSSEKSSGEADVKIDRKSTRLNSSHT